MDKAARNFFADAISQHPRKRQRINQPIRI
jgi:hypothetical protein